MDGGEGLADWEIVTNPWATWTTSANTTDWQWTNWNATTTATNETTWASWTTEAVSNGPPSTGADAPGRPGTEVDQAERQRQIAEAEAARKEAQERALELLRAHCNEAQRESLERHSLIDVVGSRGRTYRLRMGRTHNVYGMVLRLGQLIRVAEFCGHVEEAVPNADNILAQKLLIECDEDAFWRSSNRWALAEGSHRHFVSGPSYQTPNLPDPVIYALYRRWVAQGEVENVQPLRTQEAVA